MQHIESIKNYVEALDKCDIHLLIVEGPAGFAKSHTVSEAIRKINRRHETLAGYATALSLYNTLSEFRSMLVVLDDCYGLLEDPKAVSILKAATWAGVDSKRTVSWVSASKQVSDPKFEFTGKIIILCNQFPDTGHTQALTSR